MTLDQNIPTLIQFLSSLSVLLFSLRHVCIYRCRLITGVTTAIKLRIWIDVKDNSGTLSCDSLNRYKHDAHFACITIEKTVTIYFMVVTTRSASVFFSQCFILALCYRYRIPNMYKRDAHFACITIEKAVTYSMVVTVRSASRFFSRIFHSSVMLSIYSLSCMNIIL